MAPGFKTVQAFKKAAPIKLTIKQQLTPIFVFLTAWHN